jgi:G:T/U-mismatch repair DNA glycosylase
MDFFYPNWINDFWRIQGLNGFGDPRHFEKRGEKRFDLDRITEFCTSRGLAFFDTARKVCRLKGNASDEFLLILEPAPIISFLQSMPHCRTIVTTGGKASEEFLNIIRELTSSEKATVISINKLPAFGERVSLSISGRDMEWRRMPSTSRAYPMPLQEKAAYYSKLNV